MAATASDSLLRNAGILTADGVLRWLSLDDPVQCRAWERIWQAGRHRRPHDHPAYLQLVRPEGYRSAAVIYRHGQAGTILYPFFHARVDAMPGFDSVHRALRHLCSPYGYGGALYEGDPAHADAATARFDRLFSADLRERGFVSEFVREDIFSGRLACRASGERVEQQPNVVVRLDRDPDDIWRGYDHALRTHVRRARKAGLRMVADTDCSGLDDFLSVYYETMDRRCADAYFYMPRERFQHLCAALCRHRAAALLHVYDGSEVVASELLLLSRDAMYAFLSASRASAFSKRPNHFMRHEGAMWGREQGYKWYVLGGGVSPNDGIFRFKSGFDPGSTLPFYLRKVVHNPHACRMLLEARCSYEQARGSGWSPRPDYFPQYLA